MHRVNAGYTLLARVSDRVNALADLGALLATLQLPFATTTTTHFATITILPAQMYGDEELPATLMFATSYCGPILTHVKELVSVMGNDLRKVFEYCEGFHPGCSNAELELFILEHRHGDTFYSGMQHLAPADVRDHRYLRDEIGKFLDQNQAKFTGKPLATRHQIQEFVRNHPKLAWAEQPFAPPPGAFWALHWRSMILGAFVLPFIAAFVICTIARFVAPDSALGGAAHYLWIATGLILAFVVGLVLAVRDSEREQTYVAARKPDAEVKALAATQNRRVINEMTVYGPIKSEGRLRPLFLRIALWIVARAAEGIPWVPSLSSGINIPTVATARWVAADRGRRLIFISNYTNSAEPYVRDFIDVTDGAKRINLVFGFGHGYPKTKWVINDGALAYPNEFIYVVTEGQKPTAYWYGPYTDMSIDNIKINRKIREGLFARFNEKQAQAWLHLL
jgi:hypothetical protein